MKEKRTIIPIGKPITLYNADKKEVIGVFATPSLAGRYVSPDAVCLRKSGANMGNAARRNGRMPPSKTRFPFPVAVRYANAEQVESLGNEAFIIAIGYPLPLKKRMEGTAGMNRESLAKEGLEKWTLARKYPSP